MAAKKVVKKPQVVNDDEDLLGFGIAGIDEMLEGIDKEIPAYNIGDKITFVHAGGKVSGRVHKVLEEGRLKATDRAGTLYPITVHDILKKGETAQMLIARTGKKVHEENTGKPGKKRPVYQSTDSDLMEGAEPKKVKTVKDLKKGTLPTAPAKKKSGEKTQRELVEELAEAGERDYDVIAKKTGVTRVNVGQYMYRWKKANNIK